MTDYVIFKTSDPAWEVPVGWTAVDALLVGGGGASGSGAVGNCLGRSGGGGAGGLLVVEGISLTPGAEMAVTVGAGGTYSQFTGTPHTDGGNTTFAGNTAIGGGRGQRTIDAGTNDIQPASGGAPGGSGGGAVGAGTDSFPCTDTDYESRVGGAGTAGQGNAGGSVSLPGNGSDNPGAGGGGAKEAGGSPTDGETPGKGGDGYTLAELGWWDQEICNLLNPGGGNVYFGTTFEEWDGATTYPQGSVVWYGYPWRLFYANTELGPVDGPPTTGMSPSPWRRYTHALAGGAGGGSESSNEEPGIGGGAEGGNSSTNFGALANTGGGGGYSGSVTTGHTRNGAAGIVILRYPPANPFIAPYSSAFHDDFFTSFS